MSLARCIDVGLEVVFLVVPIRILVETAMIFTRLVESVMILVETVMRLVETLMILVVTGMILVETGMI